jgi:hypothetical protein
VPPVSQRDVSILASAYELRQRDIEDDALLVQDWGGSESELRRSLEQRHRWSVASEYSPFYVAALRTALGFTAP